MSCKLQVSEQTVLNLLEESVKNIPKFESKEDYAQNGRRMIYDFKRASVLRSSYRMSHSSSSKAMEVLNRINLECKQLMKLGGEEESKPLVQSKVQNDCSRHCDINNNILKLDRSLFSSKEQGVETPAETGWLNTIITNGKPFCKDCHSSTLLKVQNGKKTGEHPQDDSITGGSSHNKRTPRKQKTPIRSLEKTDPNFQGIDFQMHLCVEKERCDDYRLIITSFSRYKTQTRKF